MESHEPAPLRPAAPAPEAKHLGILLLALTLTFLADFLLWSARPGLSWGAFVATVGIGIAIRWGRTICHRRWVVLFAALMLTAAQSAVEISFSNIVVSLALLVILVGEAAYSELSPGWARISEALWAITKAPGRWFWVRRACRPALTQPSARSQELRQGIRIVAPVLLLSGAFLMLLSNGNAILGKWLSSGLSALLDWFPAFDLSIGHLIFLLFIATFSLWALHPWEAPGNTKRFWTRIVPEFQPTDRSIAWWRSALMLAAMNAIFFFANTIDAIYLWSGGALPQGVTVSQYVHEGVNSLMIAVFLSAAVLVGIFQQGRGLRDDRRLKQLGLLWVAQNGVLSAGVVLRVLRYVEAYHLTTSRVYAIAFVLLVIAGFALLACYVIRERSLNWLLLSNATATLLLLFVMQFLNVAGWVATYNVRQWAASTTKTIDLPYLVSLGAPGWEALLEVSRSHQKSGLEARDFLKQICELEKAELAQRDWRSLQLRHEWIAFQMFGIKPAKGRVPWRARSPLW